jgi:hypothetical protein
VAIMPGLMQFVRMPWAAPSAASWRVSAITPPFEALWAARMLVSDPVKPAVEPTVMIAPPRSFR